MRGVSHFPIKLTILDLFMTNINTSMKYRDAVTQEGISENGAIAISCVTDAVLGEGRDTEMI